MKHVTWKWVTKSSWGIIKLVIKIEKIVTFISFLNACHLIKFLQWQRLQWRYFVKFLYFCIFGPKNALFLKNPYSYFYLFFNASHQVQFQRTLINRFIESWRGLILDPKIADLPHFRLYKNFHKKLNVTITHSLIPVIRYNFRYT